MRIVEYRPEPLPGTAEPCWSEQSVWPLESAWSLTHKFCLWNTCRKKALVELLHVPAETRKSHSTAMNKKIHNLLLPGWISSERFERTFRMESELAEQGSAFIAFYLPSPTLRKIRANCALSLRYCPACLAGGYHSPLYQLLSVKYCPIHGDILRTGCRVCLQAIPYQIPSGYKPEPYSCACGERVWKTDLKVGRSVLRETLFRRLHVFRMGWTVSAWNHIAPRRRTSFRVKRHES